MGINKNSATEMRSGPLLYGGMAIPEVWTSQCSGGNKMLTSHLRKDDIVGQTITVKLDALQIQAGTSWNVLSQHGGHINSYVDKCWTSHIWEYNDLYGLTLHRDDAPWMLLNAKMTCSSWKSLPKSLLQQPSNFNTHSDAASTLVFLLLPTYPQAVANLWQTG